MRAELGDARRAADDDAGLRTAEELVATERDDIGAGRHRLRHCLFAREPKARRVEECATAEIVDERDAALACERRQRTVIRRRDEAGHFEVARVHAKDRCGALADRARVVLHVRAVRRADLDELRA